LTDNLVGRSTNQTGSLKLASLRSSAGARRCSLIKRRQNREKHNSSARHRATAPHASKMAGMIGKVARVSSPSSPRRRLACDLRLTLGRVASRSDLSQTLVVHAVTHQHSRLLLFALPAPAPTGVDRACEPPPRAPPRPHISDVTTPYATSQLLLSADHQYLNTQQKQIQRLHCQLGCRLSPRRG
jgi:hypothetical protein